MTQQNGLKQPSSYNILWLCHQIMDSHLLSSSCQLHLCLMTHQSGKGSFYTTQTLLIICTSLLSRLENKTGKCGLRRHNWCRMIEIFICLWHWTWRRRIILCSFLAFPHLSILNSHVLKWTLMSIRRLEVLEWKTSYKCYLTALELLVTQYSRVIK